MGRARGGQQLATRRPSRRTGARGPYKRSDPQLEADLRLFIGDGTRFPTLNDFDSAGRHDLRAAVTELGGVPYWAEVLGCELESSRRREPYTEDDAMRDARAVIAQEGRLPGECALRALGYGRLATRVRQAGGARVFRTQREL